MFFTFKSTRKSFTISGSRSPSSADFDRIPVATLCASASLNGRVEDIGYGHDPRELRDRVALQPVGVAAPVRKFVMPADAGHRLGQATQGRTNLAAHQRKLFDDFEFFVRPDKYSCEAQGPIPLSANLRANNLRSLDGDPPHENS